VRTHLTLKFQSDLLRSLAFVDGLTGVANRRQFDERLAIEWARAQRHGTPLSLILADVVVVGLEVVHVGHQAGDEALRRVAACLREAVRRGTDLVARYGGEEFVCLLPDTDADDAVRLAGQLLDAVRLMAIPHRFGAGGGVLTISLGVATRRGPAQPGWQAAALLGLADAQLYEAKRAGRARVCAAVLGEEGSV
jgi:diguanylate cyclase (GGDEF)-like protein